MKTFTTDYEDEPRKKSSGSKNLLENLKMLLIIWQEVSMKYSNCVEVSTYPLTKSLRFFGENEVTRLSKKRFVKRVKSLDLKKEARNQKRK